LSRDATAASTRSPAAYPNASLMARKPSMSSSITATGRSCRWARASACSSRSRRIKWVGSPVSGSLRSGVVDGERSLRCSPVSSAATTGCADESALTDVETAGADCARTESRGSADRRLATTTANVANATAYTPSPNARMPGIAPTRYDAAASETPRTPRMTATARDRRRSESVTRATNSDIEGWKETSRGRALVRRARPLPRHARRRTFRA
jgi:hypothetical protein